MKRFNFKLDKLLDIRVKKEEEFKALLSEYINKLELQKKVIDELKDKLNFSKNKRDALFNSVDYKNYIRYIDFLEEKIRFEENKMEDIKRELEVVRQKLMEATKERKVVENLKEKTYNEYLFELNKEEQKINDEYAIYNHFKMKGGRT